MSIKTSPELEVSEPDMTPEEQKEFLDKQVTRGEVSLFIDNYMTNQMLPQVLGYIDRKYNRLFVQLSAIQSIIIERGLITKDEFYMLMKGIDRLPEEPEPPKPPLTIK